LQSALIVDRLHFAFTVTFHYIFPQITMGLALLIVVLKTMALRPGNEHYNRAARFWARIFGINFAVGVVTGIPMEFQFGTNWSAFSQAAGGVIGQTLAMEGVFSFFLESHLCSPGAIRSRRRNRDRNHSCHDLLCDGLPPVRGESQRLIRRTRLLAARGKLYRVNLCACP